LSQFDMIILETITHIMFAAGTTRYYLLQKPMGDIAPQF
jgi:hypothetical protein